jgi:hypothetical protein
VVWAGEEFSGFFVMEKKRILWKHTVKVEGDREDHQKRRRLMMIKGFPKRIW